MMKKPLSDAELRRVLLACRNDEDRVTIWLGLAGVPLNIIPRLGCDKIHLDETPPYIKFSHKNAVRVVPLSPDLSSLLKEYARQDPIRKQKTLMDHSRQAYFQNRFQTLAEKADICTPLRRGKRGLAFSILAITGRRLKEEPETFLDSGVMA